MKIFVFLILFTFYSIVGASILQFNFERNNAVVVTNQIDVLSWKSINSTLNLSTLHTTNNMWSLPKFNGGSISFVNASPLSFPIDATNLVKKIIVVADCNGYAPWETLIDTDSGSALLPKMFENTSASFEQEGYHNSSLIKINGVLVNEINLDELFIVEFTLINPVILSDVYVGGAPATPIWGRSWNGNIYELFILDTELSEEQNSALYTYLSLKFRINVDTAFCDDSLSVLRNMNIKVGSVFSTLILWR